MYLAYVPQNLENVFTWYSNILHSSFTIQHSFMLDGYDRSL